MRSQGVPGSVSRRPSIACCRTTSSVVPGVARGLGRYLVFALLASFRTSYTEYRPRFLDSLASGKGVKDGSASSARIDFQGDQYKHHDELFPTCSGDDVFHSITVCVCNYTCGNSVSEVVSNRIYSPASIGL